MKLPETLKVLLDGYTNSKNDSISSAQYPRFLEHALKRIEKEEFDNEKGAKLCCEIIKFLSSTQGLEEYIEKRKLKAFLNRAMRLKRKALVSDEMDTDRSLSKLLCLIKSFLKKRSRFSNWMKKRVPLSSLDDCGLATKKDRQVVSEFLKKYQNLKTIQKMDIATSFFLTLFSVGSILVVLIYRINQQSLLNVLLANLVIPNAFASVVLPLLYSASKYWDRIDYRVTAAKVAFLYIVNLIATVFSFFIYTWLDSFLLVMRRWMDSLLVDFISFALFLSIVCIWVIIGYYVVEVHALRTIESVYAPSKRVTRLKPVDDNCGLNEAELFIVLNETYSETRYLIFFFTLLNLTFVLSVIQGRIFTELGDILWPYISSQSMPFIIGILVFLLFRGVFWVIINGRNTQVGLVKKYPVQKQD